MGISKVCARDCEVPGTLELISADVDMNLCIWGPGQDANPERCPLWFLRKRHLSEMLDQGGHVRGCWARDGG